MRSAGGAGLAQQKASDAQCGCAPSARQGWGAEHPRMRREGWLPFRKRSPGPKQDAPTSSEGLLLADVHRQADAGDTEFDTDWNDLSGVEVVAGEFVTVTADQGAPPHEPITRLLQQVRERTGMDVVFISQFVNGKRLVRHVASDPRDSRAVAEGRADPLEATYCQRVVDGRLPRAMADARAHPEAARLRFTTEMDVRAHVSAPVLSGEGRVFGTVCAYAHRPRPGLDEARRVVNAVARALGNALEQAEEA